MRHGRGSRRRLQRFQRTRRQQHSHLPTRDVFLFIASGMRRKKFRRKNQQKYQQNVKDHRSNRRDAVFGRRLAPPLRREKSRFAGLENVRLNQVFRNGRQRRKLLRRRGANGNADPLVHLRRLRRQMGYFFPLHRFHVHITRNHHARGNRIERQIRRDSRAPIELHQRHSRRDQRAFIQRRGPPARRCNIFGGQTRTDGD